MRLFSLQKVLIWTCVIGDLLNANQHLNTTQLVGMGTKKNEAENSTQATESHSMVFIPKSTGVSLRNIAYGVEGFVATAGNLLIVVAVATNKPLRRKELIIVAGLAMSEFTLGFAYLTAGIRRGWLEVTGYLKQPSTPWHCMWVIHSPFFAAGAVFQPFMLIMMSVDRLLAIKAPIWYWKQRNKYAYTCLFLASSCTAVYLTGGIIGAYFKPVKSDITLSCNVFMAMPDWAGAVAQKTLPLGAWGSVIIYVLVLYFYREHGKTLPNQKLIAEHKKRQRKMTKTIGICVLITLFTVCLGRTANSILYSWRATVGQETFYTLSMLITILNGINMMANVFVFSWRQREIRAAIVCMLTCGQVKLSIEKPSKVQVLRQQQNVVAPQNSHPNEA